MILRRAHADDNAALLALTRTLRLPGLAEFGIDRTPDFFALDGQLGGTAATMVLEADDGPAGFVDVALLPVRAGTVVVPGALLSLAAMHPSQRGRGHVLAVAHEFEARLRAQDVEMAIGFTSVHNARAQAFFRRWEHGAAFGTPVRLHVLMAARRPRALPGIRVRAATPADLGAIDGLVAAHRSAYDIAPVVPAVGSGGYAGLGPEDFLVAEHAREGIVACLAVWDQRAWRRNLVHAYARGVRTLVPLIDRLLVAQGRPPLPRPGEPLAFCYAAFPAALPGHERAFHELLRHALQQARPRRLHFIAFGLPDGDRLAASVRGVLRASMVALPLVAPGERVRDVARRQPLRVWLDYSLI